MRSARDLERYTRDIPCGLFVTIKAANVRSVRSTNRYTTCIDESINYRSTFWRRNESCSEHEWTRRQIRRDGGLCRVTHIALFSSIQSFALDWIKQSNIRYCRASLTCTTRGECRMEQIIPCNHLIRMQRQTRISARQSGKSKRNDGCSM